MILLKPFFRILVLSFFFASVSNSLQAQTNTVPDAVELAVLKNIYDSLGGETWTNKTNWPTTGLAAAARQVKRPANGAEHGKR